MALAAAAWLALAPDAKAASPVEVLQLRLQPCPAYRVAQSRQYSAEEVQAAKEGRFTMTYDGPAVLAPPVDWGMDPYRNVGWVHYLHGFRWLDQLLYAYVNHDDLDALAQARALILDWIAASPLPAGKPGNRWNGKTVGDRAGYVAFVTRAATCRGLLTDAQASVLIDALRTHGSALADPARYEHSNHGMFDDLGLALMGQYLGFLPEGSNWVELATDRFRATLGSRLEEREGVWLEHSAGYHFVLVRLVERFAGLIGSAGLLADLARMREAAGWFVLPDGRMVPVGDSGSGQADPWAVEEGADDSGLRLMKRSGLAVVKDRDGYLMVTAGFHNLTHKHADDLGFHLYDHGRDVISDSGNHGYNADKWREFATSVKAHSVLSVGRQNFPIYESDAAYGSGIRAGGRGAGWYAIEGRNPMLGRARVGHRRVFLYRPGRALVVIDLVRANRRKTLHRRFQLAPGLGVKPNRRGLGLRAPGFRGALTTSGKPSAISFVTGRENPPGGWSFPRGGTRVPRTTVDYRTRVSRGNLVAALGLRGQVRARLVRAAHGTLVVRVRGAGLRSDLRVKRRGARMLVRAR